MICCMRIKGDRIRSFYRSCLSIFLGRILGSCLSIIFRTSIFSLFLCLTRFLDVSLWIFRILLRYSWIFLSIPGWRLLALGLCLSFLRRNCRLFLHYNWFCLHLFLRHGLFLHCRLLLLNFILRFLFILIFFLGNNSLIFHHIAFCSRHKTILPDHRYSKKSSHSLSNLH